MQNIVVAVDFSDQSERVIQVARDLASAHSARVWLIHAAEPDPDFVGYEAGPQSVRDSVAREFRKEHRELQQIAEGLRADGIDATALLVQGPTIRTILDEAERLGADHIVVGSHGRGAISRVLLGSVSEGVVHKAPCTVTVVRPTTTKGDSSE